MQADEIRYKEDMPALGLNWIRLGLDDVLYDPKTKTIYTPNTNASVKVGEGGIAVDGEEERYSPDQPRDENGRFTFGSGGGNSGKSIDKSTEPAIMKTGLKISMQFFGKKRASIWLSKKEYGKIKHEINTEYYNKYDGKDVFVHRSVYNNTYYDYRVRNYGFDNYVFIARSRSK